MVGLIQQGRQGRQRLLTVGHHSHIGLDVLVYLTLVDIKVYNLRLLGVCLRITCHAVAETHTNGNEHVALLFLQVHSVVAVHAQHTDIQGMVRGQRRES